MLGSQEGTVHHQRQGTGKATILGSEDWALKDFLSRDMAAKKAASEVAAAKRAAAAESAKAITEFNPERWLRHDKELKGRIESLTSKGAELLRNGVNPNSGIDEASVAWRKEKSTIEAMAKASMQMKDMFQATRGKIDGSEPDKYDDDALNNMRTYFEMPLDQVVKDGVLPPPLLQKKPGLNLQKTWAGLTKDLYDRNGNKPLDEAGMWDFVRASMSNDPEVSESTVSYFHNLPGAEQEAYKQRAQKTGMSVNELINYDFMKRYSPGKEPFDLNAYIQKGADAIDVPYISYRNPEKFGKYVDSKEFSQIAGTKAAAMLVDPEALYSYQSLFPMKEGESEGTYRARAVKDLASRLRKMKATSTEAGLSDKGGEAKDIQVSAEKWLEHIKSSDKGLNARAANFLYESNGMLGNMNVTRSEVLTTQEMPWLPEANDPGKTDMKWLRIDLKGAPGVKEVKDQLVQNGIKTEDVRYESVGADSFITIPITDATENALLRMHDKAYKTGSRIYDPEPLQWSADLKPAAKPTNQKPKSQF